MFSILSPGGVPSTAPNNDVSVTLPELQHAGAQFLGSDLPSYLGSLKLNDFKTIIPDLQYDLRGAPPYNGSLLKDAPNIINTVESFIGQHPSETLRIGVFRARSSLIAGSVSALASRPFSVPPGLGLPYRHLPNKPRTCRKSVSPVRRERVGN